MDMVMVVPNCVHFRSPMMMMDLSRLSLLLLWRMELNVVILDVVVHFKNWLKVALLR